ncbi:Protein FAM183A [Geodia barretti]|uniref:Protein FAM183A n=1 Tax=Geodia barretti TaxID=519541 RepID=A0AA35QVK3_GEOBA|nr:Protein FAM183A [Geodia barretti]
MFMRCPGNKMAGAEEKEPENIVHRNAIFCETIHKEQRDQKLYTSYGVNPYKKTEFLQTYREAQGAPRSRYSYPQTEAQEIGWDTKPLVEQPRNDRRLHHPHVMSEITKYMDAAWRQKEQESMQQ